MLSYKRLLLILLWSVITIIGNNFLEIPIPIFVCMIFMNAGRFIGYRLCNYRLGGW